ncbi:unnamed protein product [Calypogeia fissa]
METQVEQSSSPPSAPPGLNPLAKLGWQINVNKYKPTARETEVLAKCYEDGRSYFLNSTLLSAAIMWNVTGIGRTKLKLIPRIFMTGVAAMMGREVGGRIAGYSCMKRILSLDGSPLRAELISILQEDYPDHSLLKTDIGRLDPLSKSASELEDYAQEAHAPVSPKDWASEIEVSTTKSSDWPELLGRGSGYDQQERSGRIPRIWEIRERKEAVSQDNGADILADPFDLVMQTGLMVDELNDVDVNVKDHVERRRSRMGAKERREYDRTRYEERHVQEHRSY